ncbi:MAG TPA: protein translocase subunit SecD [Alphaproteobacteria bacterium]|nr:protein translocase subunit SecD [Alphaproteobacteria bacterium]
MNRIARWKIFVIFGICLLGGLVAAPNLMTREQVAKLPSWLSHARLNLGLDLQGGLHFLYEVNLQPVVNERMEDLVQSVREILRKERIGYTRLGIAGQNTPNVNVGFQLSNAADVAKVRQLIRDAEPGFVIDATAAGQFTLRYDEATLRERRNQVLGQSIEIIRRRVDEFGTNEPYIQRIGENRIQVQVPGATDSERIKSVISQTARLSFRMVDTTLTAQEARASGRVPAGSELLPSADKNDALMGRPTEYLIQRRTVVGGDNLVDAQAAFQNGEAVVSFRFDSSGARRFADTTKQNVGKPFAIVLDDKVISAPVIREPILGGSGIISGSFTTESARDLALLLRAGALPAPLTVLEERTVGPDLGSDSIDAGKMACIIGYFLIFILMVARYRAFGMIANIALFMNLVFTVAIMSLMGATLTLPGIAGMVLGLAMAVDANVLIYERMREETKMGRSPLPAADLALQRAYVTILDSNMTTLVAAFFLYILGSGPVRGFAVTLGIGLICSMFTAVTLTRLLMIMWISLRRVQKITI